MTLTSSQLLNFLTLVVLIDNGYAQISDSGQQSPTSEFSKAAVLQKTTPANLAADQEAEKPKNTAEERIAGLIDDMLTGGFSVRQRAIADLMNLGAAALPDLRRAVAQTKDGNQARLLVLIEQIQDREFAARLAALQQSPSIENAHQFPGWQRFQALAGNSPEILGLFLEIQAAQPQLFATAMFNSSDLPLVLEERSQQLSQKLDGRTAAEFPAAAYAGLLLLGSDPEIRLIRATSTNISQGLADQRFSKLVEDGKSRAILRALVGSWIQRPGISAERPLLFAIRHQMTEGKTLARRLIEARSRRFDMILALTAMAALGDLDDLPLLESAFETDVVLWPPRGQTAKRRDQEGQLRDTNFQVQTKDVALAAALHIRGVDFRQFQLDVQPDPLTVFAIDTLVFDNETTRKAAFDSYLRAFSAPD